MGTRIRLSHPLRGGGLRGEDPTKLGVGFCVRKIAVGVPQKIHHCDRSRTLYGAKRPQYLPLKSRCFLAIKDPDWYMTQWQRAYVPNGTGESVLSYDGKTLITVPAGAAGVDFYLEYTPMRAPSHPVEPLASANQSFDLSAFDIQNNPIAQFTLPLTIHVSYEDEMLGDVREETLGLYYWNISSGSWEDAVNSCPGGGYTRNAQENWISLTVCHLCEFSLMGLEYFSGYLPMLLR